MNYPYAISPNCQQHLWVYNRFSHGFCIFTGLFLALFLSNVIINDPFFISCDNYVQERFHLWCNSKEIATETGSSSFCPVWERGIDVSSLETNPFLFKRFKTIEISIFKQLAISCGESFCLFFTTENRASSLTSEGHLEWDWLFSLKSRWRILPSHFNRPKTWSTIQITPQEVVFLQFRAYSFLKCIGYNMAKV